MGVKVQGPGFRVQGLGFRVQGLLFEDLVELVGGGLVEGVQVVAQRLVTLLPYIRE